MFGLTFSVSDVIFKDFLFAALIFLIELYNKRNVYDTS